MCHNRSCVSDGGSVLFTGAFSGDVVVYPALFVVMVLLVAAKVLLVLVQPCHQHGEGTAMAQLNKKLDN